MSVVELISEDDSLVLWGKDEKPFVDVEKSRLKCHNGDIHMKLIRSFMIIQNGVFLLSCENRLLWFPFHSDVQSEFFNTYIQSPDKQQIALDNGSICVFQLLCTPCILSSISVCSIKPHIYDAFGIGKQKVPNSYDIKIIWDKGVIEVSTSSFVTLEMINLIYSSTLNVEPMIMIGNFCLEPSRIHNISLSSRNALSVQTLRTSSWIFIDYVNNDETLQYLYYKVPPILQKQFYQTKSVLTKRDVLLSCAATTVGLLYLIYRCR
jgi:hypothetical protein